MNEDINAGLQNLYHGWSIGLSSGSGGDRERDSRDRNTVPPPPQAPADSSGSIVGTPLVDLFSVGSSQFLSPPPRPGKNYMTAYYLRRFNALRCDLYLWDFSGGMDAQVRRIAEGQITNELSYAQATARFPQALNLPPLLTTDSSPDYEIGSLDVMSSCRVNDGGTMRWLAAAGGVANKCLFHLDPFSPQTYSPGSAITGLWTVRIATAAERVIVGRQSAAPQVLSGFSGTPTVAGTMHSNLNPLWGVIRTGLNSTTPGAETLLLYANTRLYRLSSTAAIGDAPTQVLSNWPNGGYSLGIATLASDGVARAYWVHPTRSLTQHMLTLNEPGYVISTNLEGLDPKVIDMGMPFVKQALIWQDGIVATDGKQIVFNNGDVEDLGWNRERRWSDYPPGFGVVHALAVVDKRLFACTSGVIGDFNDIVGPAIWEEFIPETGQWQFFCVANPDNTTGASVAMFAGTAAASLPHQNLSADTGRFFWYSAVGGGLYAQTYAWRTAQLLPQNVPPQWQQSESAHIAYEFATSGFVETPVYHCYEGLPKIVSDIWYGGELKGTGSKVTVTVAKQLANKMSFEAPGVVKAEFHEGDDWRNHYWVCPEPNATLGDRLQFRISLTQGTSGSYVTKSSPNALPLRIGFYVFLDGVPKDPMQMEPNRYRGIK